MTYHELQGLYLRIVSGITIVEYEGKEYHVYDPKTKYQLWGRKYYNKVYEKLISEGCLNECQCEALLIEKGSWSVEQEQRVKDLEENLKKFNQQLPLLEFKSNEKKTVVRYIEVTKAEISRLNKIKNALLANSAEYIARLEVYKRYLFWLAHNEYGNRIWETWYSFCQADSNFINILLTEAYLENDLNDTNIRALARNEPWRSTWLTSCKTGHLFPHANCDMTDYQRTLVSWSLIYDNAFEHPECPSYDVIQNDVLFDQWMLEQSEKRKKESQKRPEDFITNSAIKNSQEIGIVVDSPEDAKRIYALNDPLSMQTVKSREKTIVEKGVAKETDMPDVRHRLQMMLNNQQIDHIKKG